MSTLNVTVCELPDDRARFDTAWTDLCNHARAHRSDVVLLPEMPFAPWLAATPTFDSQSWQAAERAHDEWQGRLGELAPAETLASRPVTRDGRRLNEGFVWSEPRGYRAVHHKRYLPDEDNYWEAHWYSPGDGSFDVFVVAGARAGMTICTDQWSLGHAQRYGKAGAQLVVTPRATGKTTVDKWLVGGRAVALVSGAFGLSSNWSADETGGDFGGCAWIIGPDGDVLARTTARRPCVTMALDLTVADMAKQTYPRYALD